MSLSLFVYYQYLLPAALPRFHSHSFPTLSFANSSYFKDKELSFNVWCSQFSKEGRSGGIQFFPEGRSGAGGRRTGVAGATLRTATRSGRMKAAIPAPGDEDNTRCSLQ